MKTIFPGSSVLQRSFQSLVFCMDMSASAITEWTSGTGWPQASPGTGPLDRSQVR
jgi:hypothetical protein